ncbi:C-X-C chemokine receptor type 5 isoform X2 [Archocentrus centrarchus]|uniref:C-X-C chemokine receptor type 5 isoform X2 n=1 Tax=Archocentrus centrarchus TaxID=63155 RepID=UPI0011EA192D|nr:C-X-C chemokine receptor type 5 isoform X2 [Archocentrus centrarchus]
MAMTMTYTVFEAESDDDNWTNCTWSDCTGPDCNWTDCNWTDGTGPDCICDYTASLHSFYTVFLPVLYSVIFLLGVAGNGLMITVLLTRCRRLRITEIYLLHLAMADLMLLFTIPFNVADSATGWVFGVFVCKLNELLKSLNLICGSFLLACIGFDRYLAIVHAVPSMQSRFPRTVHLTCAALWLICLALALPNAVFATVTQKDQSSDTLICYYHNFGIHAHNWVLTSNVLHHVCFFIPLAIMSFCYTMLIFTLCKSQKSEAKKGAIRIALLVTLVFCFCWLPFNISLMVQTLRELEVIAEDCESGKIMLQALEVTKSLGITHCCLNPFLYAFVGVRFRNEMIQLLCKLGCSRICLPLLRVHRHSRTSTSDGATTNSLVLI